MSNAMQSEAKNETKQVLNQEDLKQVRYMHDDPYGPVFSLYVLENGLCYLQSISQLDNAIHYETSEYLRGPDVLYACEEGVYKWNDANQDYDFVGKIIKTVRKKKIVIQSDNVTVNHKNGIIHLKQNEEYEVKKECITYHQDAEPDVIYVLQGKGTVTFELAYDEKTQKLVKEDLAMIDREAKEWGSHAVRAADPIPF
jgi:cupin superfamily acireductone dioxygenase involved in methionine salvage